MLEIGQMIIIMVGAYGFGTMEQLRRGFIKTEI